ncbi:protein MHF2 homolog isoform X2 [Abrus precatorius]|uniref:Protein MHF2 homolog isoform X2 n=1 Tax=Abrus precatorius TaxID=3816 RepID=A0A8B8JQG0_ABRPR|nr:protein MHF2 homolog isoform X2 [Abrus precatorius]
MLKLTIIPTPRFFENFSRFVSNLCDMSLVELAGIGTSRKNRPTSANANAVRLTSELLRVFITEAVQRAAAIAEAEGANQIEASHLEIILPQLLLDF